MHAQINSNKFRASIVMFIVILANRYNIICPNIYKIL